MLNQPQTPEELNMLLKDGCLKFNFMQAREHLIKNHYKSRDVDSVLTNHFRALFIHKLKEAIDADIDIKHDVFVDSILSETAERLSLSQKDIHHFSLINICRYFFPFKNFHTQDCRNARYHMEETRFQRELADLDAAFQEGARIITGLGTAKGNFEAGRIAENAWAKILDEYNGKNFDIHQNKIIRTPEGDLSEFDIILTKKDTTHKTKPITDVVMLNDVVAVFEVKRTLKKQHIQIGNDKAEAIFKERCYKLKNTTMPDRRYDDIGLTPFQMLRGKVFFGILCLDCESGIEDQILTDKYLTSISIYEQKFDNIRKTSGDLAPDIIYCPNKLLWQKKISLKGISSYCITHQVEFGKNTLDSSVTGFGNLIQSLRKFIVGQGLIEKNAIPAYMKHYSAFSFLPSENSKRQVRITMSDSYFPHSLHRLISYLGERIPNEHSGHYLRRRAPLELLRAWPQYVSEDIRGYIKFSLKRITRLEEDRFYKPIPDGISFDDYFETLFSDY